MNEGKMVGEFTAEEATQEKIMSAILSSDKKNKEVSA
jgi:putative multiple sugar transport system ATP-binding protein